MTEPSNINPCPACGLMIKPNQAHMCSPRKIVYNISYSPARYFAHEITPQNPQPGAPLKYYAIIDKADGRMKAWTFEENLAKEICLALDVVNAHVNGDIRAATELMRALERLRQ